MHSDITYVDFLFLTVAKQLVSCPMAVIYKHLQSRFLTVSNLVSDVLAIRAKHCMQYDVILETSLLEPQIIQSEESNILRGLLINIYCFQNNVHQGHVEFDESGARVYSQVELLQFRNGKLHGIYPIQYI